MNSIIELLQTKIPVGGAVEAAVSFLQTHFRGFFRQITAVLDGGLSGMESFFLWIHPVLLILLVSLASWFVVSKRAGIFTLLGLFLIYNLGLWSAAMTTLTMVIMATVISVLLGIPIGIWTAKSKRANRVIMPIMDFMQTMPAFVYLIPAVSFFSIGKVPGVIATIIFSIPPAIRLTGLGIRQVPVELTEAADAFGSTGMQKLVKVQFPLALPTIMAGVNQTIMLSLSMVVISAMIGAGGLGKEVWGGIQRMQIGKAFEAGLAVVILAMILDKITQNIAKNNK